MIGLLDNIKREDLESIPFRHISRSNVLPDTIYSKLNAAFPEELIISTGSKPEPGKYSLSFANIDQGSIDPVWYTFLQYHISSYFVDKCLTFFGSDIIKKGIGIYNDLRLGNFGVRYSDTHSHINIDAMFILEEPHQYIQYHSRSPHYDKAQKLCGILFYMKKSNDMSSGRDFLMYDTTQETAFDGVYVENKNSLILSKTIEYSSNNFIWFPMHPETAIHCAGDFQCQSPTIDNRRRYVEVLITLGK